MQNPKIKIQERSQMWLKFETRLMYEEERERERERERGGGEREWLRNTETVFIGPGNSEDLIIPKEMYYPYRITVQQLSVNTMKGY
jgi:hypothetical protein